MYKLLLCWRYLRTRYIALASIISVTLGVFTMIVVNSVMSGFAVEMQNRIHGILSDVTVDVRSLGGAPDAEGHMREIRRVAGDAIEGMTAIVKVPAMLSFRFGDETITRQVQLIGIDTQSQGQVSDFTGYLQHPKNREQFSFELREGGYDTRDHQGGPECPERPQMQKAGWEWRRYIARLDSLQKSAELRRGDRGADGPQQNGVENPFDKRQKGEPAAQFDKSQETYPGLVMGIVLGSFRGQDGRDRFVLLPGDDVTVSFPTAGTPPKISNSNFTIVDFYECKMSEYDASFVFVPIEKLQEYRSMFDNGVPCFNSIQIKLKPGADGMQVRDKLQDVFPRHSYLVQTWQDQQGPLLAAVHMESAILNILLFCIIAVSGFGILAIFFMIVVEKTRDIGILKSLGASGKGIMGIFLTYGLSLGLVGSGVGMAIGLLFVRNINWIADRLSDLTGRPVFDPSIYYFYKIPTLVDPWTVSWIVFGAVGIAVLASILPALRAALLHPVEALRYE